MRASIELPGVIPNARTAVGNHVAMEGAAHVEDVYQRTFGSSSFTCAPRRYDRAALENEQAQRARAARYGQQEPPAMAQYRAMEPDATVAQLQELEREIWALGREKRRIGA